MTRLSRLTAVLLLLILATGFATASEAGKKAPSLLGKFENGTYTSPGRHLKVTPPKPVNVFGVPYSLEEATAEGYTEEVVTFRVGDFGEVLMAGVATAPADSSPEAARARLSAVPDIVLGAWKHHAQGREVLADSMIQTQYGASVLRLYLAPKGSLLTIQTKGTAAERYDALVAMIVARHEDHVVYGLAELDDLTMPSEGGWKSKDAPAKIVQRVRTFFAGIIVD